MIKEKRKKKNVPPIRNQPGKARGACVQLLYKTEHYFALKKKKKNLLAQLAVTDYYKIKNNPV